MPHSKQRYLFIDLLRFSAVVFMIQGHTFDALLDFGVRTGLFFFVHDFFHGFTAPMFLFASGVAFGISTFKKWEEHAVPGPRLRRRVLKFAGLLVIGYALHMPFFSLQKIAAEATDAEIAVWLQADALHCIAATSLLLQGAVLALKTERRFTIAVSAAAAAVILTSPLIWTVDLTGRLPLWLVSYLNAGNNSWFPLFPWSAYILAGVTFSWLFINAKEHHHALRLMKRMAAGGAVAFAAGLVLVQLPFHLYPLHDVWKVNPLIVLARLGFVSVVTSGVFFLEHSVRITSALPQVMGRESLFIYVLHLLILYGSVLNKGLQQLVLPTLSIVESAFVFVLVLAGITGFTYGWYQFKTHYRREAGYTRAALAALFILFFLLRPY